MATSEKSSLPVVVSLVLIALAVAFLVHRLMPRSDAMQMNLVAVMSQKLAEEIDSLNQGPARIVCVSRESAPSLFASEKAVRTFRAAAEKQGHTIVAEEYVPLAEMHSTDEGILLKVANLVGLMGRHSDATVFVSFVGVPHLESGDAEQLSAQSAQFVAVAYEDSSLSQLLADKAVDLAVVFHESTPINDREVTKAELEQFITFRRAGE